MDLKEFTQVNKEKVFINPNKVMLILAFFDTNDDMTTRIFLVSGTHVDVHQDLNPVKKILTDKHWPEFITENGEQCYINPNYVLVVNKSTFEGSAVTRILMYGAQLHVDTPDTIKEVVEKFCKGKTVLSVIKNNDMENEEMTESPTGD